MLAGALLFLATFSTGCGARLVSGDLPEVGAPEEVRVARVTDGDTVEISPAIGGMDDVRLIGIDAPERSGSKGPQPYADEATEFTGRSIAASGYRAVLRFDVERTDGYGRLLAYLYLEDGRMLNEMLVREGYAQIATFPPNVRHAERFREAQNEARAAGRGIWGLPEGERCRLTDRGNGLGGGC